MVVGSTNPAKLEGTRSAFERTWRQLGLAVGPEVVGHPVPPGPDQPAQPIGTVAIVEGARRRAREAMEQLDGPGYGVGVEAGVVRLDDLLMAVQFAVVVHEGREGVGQSTGFLLPPGLADDVLAGEELAEVVLRRFPEVDGDQLRRKGVVHLLSGGLVDRVQLVDQAVTSALFPFLL